MPKYTSPEIYTESIINLNDKIKIENFSLLTITLEDISSLNDIIDLLHSSQRALSTEDGPKPDFTLSLTKNILTVEGNIRSCLIMLRHDQFIDSETTKILINNINKKIDEIDKNDVGSFEKLTSYNKNFHQVSLEYLDSASKEEKEFLDSIEENTSLYIYDIKLSTSSFAQISFLEERQCINYFNQIQNLGFNLTRQGLNLYVDDNLEKFFEALSRADNMISNEPYTLICNKISNYSARSSAYPVTSSPSVLFHSTSKQPASVLDLNSIRQPIK